MDKRLILLPLLGISAPATAQPADNGVAKVQQALQDPRIADKMSATIQSLGDALLDLRVGELQAAVDGRQATPAEKALTVRDLARRDDPQFDARFRQQLAESGPAIRRGIDAMAKALPAMRRSIDEAAAALDRATANLPSPTYPKR